MRYLNEHLTVGGWESISSRGCRSRIDGLR